MVGARPERRLVEHDQARLAHQAAADRQHLLLAARQRAGGLLAALGEAREQAEHALQRLLLQRARMARRGAHLEVLQHREVGEDLAAFGDMADARLADALARPAGDVAAVEADACRTPASRCRGWCGSASSCRRRWRRRWPRSRRRRRRATRRRAPGRRRRTGRPCRPGGACSRRLLLAEIDVEHRLVARDLLRRALGDLLAVAQHHDLGGQRHDRAHDVLDQQDGEAGALVELAQEGHHDVDLGGPQPGHHLVEQQQLGLGGERARHFEALAVGQGQAFGELVAAVVEAEARQDRRGSLARLGEMGLAMQCAHGDVLQHAQALERLDDLEGAADAGIADAVGPQPGDRPAVELHGARSRARTRRRSC